MLSMTFRVSWGFDVCDVIFAMTVVVTGSNDLAVILEFL